MRRFYIDRGLLCKNFSSFPDDLIEQLYFSSMHTLGLTVLTINQVCMVAMKWLKNTFSERF